MTPSGKGKPRKINVLYAAGLKENQKTPYRTVIWP